MGDRCRVSQEVKALTFEPRLFIVIVSGFLVKSFLFFFFFKIGESENDKKLTGQKQGEQEAEGG